MKFAKIILVLLISLSLYQCHCPCEQGQDFSIIQGKCLDFPKEGEQGYIANCMRYSYDDSVDNRWECGECYPQFYQGENDLSCIDGGVEHCVNYDQGVCAHCDSGYYLDEQICKVNPDSVDNCKIYRINEENNVYCYECKDGYYSKGSDKCIKYPNNIEGCKHYYADGNDAACSHCEEEYMSDPIDGKCHKIQDKIVDCVEGKEVSPNLFRCDRCIQGKMVQQMDQNNSDVCVPNPIQSDDENSEYIENCRVYEKNVELAVYCIQCNEHFGLKDQNICEAVSVKVDGCQDYELENGVWKCEQCKSNFFEDKYDDISSCSECPYIEKDKNSSGNQLRSSFVFLVLGLIPLLI